MDDQIDPTAFAAGAAAGVANDSPPAASVPQANSAMKFVQGLLDPSTVQAPPAAPPSSAMKFVQGLLDPSTVAPDVIASAVRNGQPVDEVAADLASRGVDENAVRQHYGLEAARSRYRNSNESGLNFTLGRIPGVGSGLSIGQALKAKVAYERLKAGTADEDHFKTIAQHERMAELDRQRSTGGAVVRELTKIPAILGEMAVAGPVLSRVRGGLIGRAAVMPALVPSLGAAEGAINRSIEQGGSPLHPKNLAPAYAQSALAAAVLGSLQGPLMGRVPGGRLGRAVAGGIAGTGEQQAADAIQSTVDKILPEAYKSRTDYGLLGDLAKGREGEAMKKGIVQTATFAAFAGLHGKPTKPLIDLTKTVLAEAKAADIPPDRALDALTPGRRAYQEALARDPSLGREDVEALAQQFPEGDPSRQELELLAAVHNPKPVAEVPINKPAEKTPGTPGQDGSPGVDPGVPEPAPEPPQAATLPTETVAKGLDRLNQDDQAKLAKFLGYKSIKELKKVDGQPWLEKTIDNISREKAAKGPQIDSEAPAAPEPKKAEIAPPEAPAGDSGPSERPVRGEQRRLTLGEARTTKDFAGNSRHEHKILAGGEHVGDVRLVPKDGGRTLHVEWMGGAGKATGEGDAGMAGVRAKIPLIKALAARYPAAEQVTFHREHGASPGLHVVRIPGRGSAAPAAPPSEPVAADEAWKRLLKPADEGRRNLVKSLAGLAQESAGPPPARRSEGKRKAAPPAGEPGTVYGKPTRVTVDNGRVAYPGKYVVREMDTVVASHKAEPPFTFRDRVKTGEYPEGLQPRDYSIDKKEQMKVIDQARNLQPEAMLAEHPDAAAGPSTITADGTVINGNGRQMMLERSRDLGTYDAYKKALIERAALYGLDPAELAKKMKHPVLYREVGLDARSPEARQFARAGNRPIGKMQSVERMAAGDADLIDEHAIDSMKIQGDETFSQAINDPVRGRSFRQKMYERLPTNVRDLLFDASDTKNVPLTEVGKNYVQNMMLAKLLPINLVETFGSERKKILNNVEGSVPQLLAMKNIRPEADLTPQLMEALNFLARNPDVKSPGDVVNALDQLSLITGLHLDSISPGGRMMLDFVMKNQGTKQFRTAIGRVLSDEKASASSLIPMDPSEFDPIENIATLLGVKYRRGATFGALKEFQDAAKALASDGRSQQAIQDGLSSLAREAAEAPRAAEPEPLAASASEVHPAADGGAVGNVADRGIDNPDFSPDLSRAAPAPPGARDKPDPVRDSGGAARAVVDFLKGESGHYWMPSYDAVRDAIVRGMQYVRDETDKWGGKIAPRITRLSRAVGERLGEYVSVSDYVEKALPRYLDNVLGEKMTDAERHLHGTVATEWQLQYTKAAYRNKAATERDPDLRAKYKEAADQVRSVIGPDSPVQTEAQYKALVTSPEFIGILGRYKTHFVPDMERLFKEAQGMDDADTIDSFTQVPGYPMNLKAATIHESATAVPTTHPSEIPYTHGPGAGPPIQRVPSPAAGNLKNPRVSKLGTANERKGAAEAYDTDLAAMLEASLKNRYRLAKKAAMLRTAIDEQIAIAGPEKGRPDIGGLPSREIPNVFTRGTAEGKKGNTSLFIHPDAYNEMRQALEVDERTNWPVIKALNTGLTKASLMSTVEAAYHTKNQVTFLMMPGVSPIRDLLPNAFKVLTKDKTAQARLIELARIGAAKPKGFDSGTLWGGKTDPTTWAAKFLDLVDSTMRLTADDAFTRLVGRKNPLTGKPLITDTQTARRDFINQLGQYKKSAQSKLTVFLRDSGLGPFATAGMNYLIQSVRSLTMNAGVRGDSLSSEAILRGEKLAKTVGLLAATGLANYLMWGRWDGDDSTPLGGLKVGDKNGHISYMPLSSLAGIGRGMRETGLLAIAEGVRSGQHAGVVADKATDDLFHAIIHPVMGPGLATAYTAMTGKNTMGTRVSSNPRTKGGDIDPTGSQSWEDLKAALRNANPLYAQATGFNKPPKEADERAGRTIGELTAAQKGTMPGRPTAEVPVDERLMQLLGPFGVKTRKKMSFAEQRGIDEAMRRRRMGMR